MEHPLTFNHPVAEIYYAMVYEEGPCVANAWLRTLMPKRKPKLGLTQVLSYKELRELLPNYKSDYPRS
jgi:hypothetical protein